ncbi:ATP-binding protein [Microbaculum sp. FT89]|uniref:ATP-binding protein n=1 Tax=Microbaculum sp. FT89 TaxID=3447298 RepID=UPI003F53E503
MRLLPKSFSGQLALLLFLALLVAQLVTFVLFAGERMRASRQSYQESVVERAITLKRLMQDIPPAMRGRLLEAASEPRVKFWGSDKPSTRGGRDKVSDFLATELAAALELPRRSVRVAIGVEKPGRRAHWWSFRDGRPPPPQRIGWFKAAIELEDGGWMNIATAPPPGPRPFGRPLLVSLLISTAAMLVAAMLVARRIVRPMRALADAAEGLGRGEAIDALPETGPEEARRSVRAFNEMRERLDRFVRDRTHLLAAISHDLRTPLTSLRLRAELLDDVEMREKMIATIEEMQHMTEATLAFVRADQAEEETRSIDLAALVDSLAADLVELGQSIEVNEEARPVVRGRTVALRRAIRNVIENAVRYGERARVTVSMMESPSEARVLVEDDGPGLPESDLERVFEPFVRGEASRSRDTGGIGLGLAVARSIVRSHGGDIWLENRPAGGLRVVMTLPA